MGPDPGNTESAAGDEAWGRIIVVDNFEHDITADPAFWTLHGFACEAIDTAFEFDSLDYARRLLGLYFGDSGSAGAHPTLSYRVGLFHTVV